MMFEYIAPFLVVFALIIFGGSVYFAVLSILRSRTPKQIECTTVNYINFKNHFSC